MRVDGTMIVVVDTHVFVGACLGTGAAADVIASCLRGEHVPLMGSALMSEYEDVLALKPTVVTICYGLNAAGYCPPTEEVRASFVGGTKALVVPPANVTAG